MLSFRIGLGLLSLGSALLCVAVGPTLEILSTASLQSGPAGQGRAQWGLPVSVEIDRGAARIYGSSGYFSPAIWYAGAGFGRPVSSVATVVLAPNPGPMTLDGTNTWVLRAPGEQSTATDRVHLPRASGN